MSEVVVQTAPSGVKKKPRSIFEALSVDAKAVEEGRWFNNILGDRDEENIDLYPGVDVKLRRLTSKHAIKARQRAEKEYRQGPNRAGPLPDDVLEKIMIEQLACGVMVDWRGVIGEDGEPLPFSADTARAVLTALPDFKVIVIALSNDLESFKSERREAIEGN